MKNKKTLIYSIIIIVLTLVLGVLWFFIIDTVNNSASNVDGGGMPEMNGGGGGNSSVSYSAVKEITTDENIEGGEFVSSNADENAILVSGNITANLSNIAVSHTGDSDGGDKTSF